MITVMVRVSATVRVSLVSLISGNALVALSRQLVYELITSGQKMTIYKRTFSSVWTKNSNYLLINFRPHGRKIAIYNCKFPSMRTENSQ